MYTRYPVFYNYETLEYGRKSRSDDPLLTVEEVLENYSKIIDDYAQTNLGGSIPEENRYREIESSETIDERPEMLRLLKRIENPAIKAVAVVEVQRLSRGDLEDAGRLIKLLRYTNTYVITPTKIYDLRDDYDRDAFERELKKGNEYLEYYKKIQRRGKLSSVMRGNYVGSVAPFGFYRVPIKDGKKECFTLAEKKEEADIVRLIFKWYCEDEIGATAICRRLEEMNIKTKQNLSNWEPSIIFSMLENVHYIGQVRWNWRKTIKTVEDQIVKEIRPKAKVDEYFVFDGKHDGLVPIEIFEKAKEIRGNKPPVKTDTTLKNPFSGIMFCSCGSKIGYNTYRKHGVEVAKPKLVCNNQVRCKTGSADFSEVMNYIIRSLKSCIKDFEVLIKSGQTDSVKLHKNLIDNLEKKMKELEEQEKLQWAAQYSPDPSLRMPPHIFKELNEKLLADKDEVNKALCTAYESMPRPVDYGEKIMKFTDAINALENPNISAKIKNQYLKDILERIEYERPPNIRITKRNKHLYEAELKKGLQYHISSYKIRIIVR